jgi:hypothetical protein
MSDLPIAVIPGIHSGGKRLLVPIHFNRQYPSIPGILSERIEAGVKRIPNEGQAEARFNLKPLKAIKQIVRMSASLTFTSTKPGGGFCNNSSKPPLISIPTSSSARDMPRSMITIRVLYVQANWASSRPPSRKTSPPSGPAKQAGARVRSD